MLSSASILFVASLFAALPVQADGIYTKNSPVLQLNAQTYNSLIAKSNYTSVSHFITNLTLLTNAWLHRSSSKLSRAAR